MTREQVVQYIHWRKIIWFAGLVNVVAMLPQLIQILRTQETAGLSTGMFWIYFLIQIAFALEGYFTRNKMFMWCLGLSAFVSALILFFIYYFRV